jgi:hypothetical protein
MMDKMNSAVIIPVILFGFLVSSYTQSVNFSGVEHLGNPTGHSIAINVVPESDIYIFYQYGTTSGVYTGQTTIDTAPANRPYEIVITGLQANTRYYYRMAYSVNGINWTYRNEHTFHTQRAAGEEFVFTITADSHINIILGNIALYRQALNWIAADNPDFNLDLGDTFAMDGVSDSSTAYANYLFQRSSDCMGRISPSVPIFLAMGNHENEEGWNFDDAYPQPIFSINARKKYFPTPVSDGFYSGNIDVSDPRINGDHLREDYYAWEWGDALFIVFDPFQYTMQNPYGAGAGEGGDDPATGDRWNWTMGEQQYNWFKQVIENSMAKYKFIFAHHLLGGTQNYVREGATPALWFEWGGYNVNSSNQNPVWQFNTRRPGWPEPIHQLMIDNNVNAFFHGHDHEYAYEIRDGIVYQEVPSPSMTNGSYGFNLYSESDLYTIRVLPNAGYLRVTVSPVVTTVDYINTVTGNVTYTYTIDPNEDNPLPVSLSSFKTTVVENGIELKWITESQLNNAGFEIWRSDNTTDFCKIADYLHEPALIGDGNSSTRHEYCYLDQQVEAGKTYAYKLSDVSYDGSRTYHKVITAQIEQPIAKSFALYPNYPNPFNPQTVIRFLIPENEENLQVAIRIYNVYGQLIRTLFNNKISAGEHEITWDSCNDHGTKIPSGVYFLEMNSARFRSIQKMTLLK